MRWNRKPWADKNQWNRATTNGTKKKPLRSGRQKVERDGIVLLRNRLESEPIRSTEKNVAMAARPDRLVHSPLPFGLKNERIPRRLRCRWPMARGCFLPSDDTPIVDRRTETWNLRAFGVFPSSAFFFSIFFFTFVFLSRAAFVEWRAMDAIPLVFFSVLVGSPKSSSASLSLFLAFFRPLALFLALFRLVRSFVDPRVFIFVENNLSKSSQTHEKALKSSSETE